MCGHDQHYVLQPMMQAYAYAEYGRLRAVCECALRCVVEHCALKNKLLEGVMCTHARQPRSTAHGSTETVMQVL